MHRIDEDDLVVHLNDVVDDIASDDVSLLLSTLLQEQEGGYRCLLDVRSTLRVIDRRFSVLVNRDASAEIARRETLDLLSAIVLFLSRTEAFSESYIASSERILNGTSQNEYSADYKTLLNAIEMM